MLVTCSDVVKIWSFDSVSKRISLENSIQPHTSTINCVIWNHNNNVVASCSNDGNATLISAQGSVLDTLAPKDQEPLACLTFHNARSRYMAAAGNSSIVYVWDMKKSALIRTLQGHRAAVRCCRFDPSDEHVASGAADGRLLVHQIRASAAVLEARAPHGAPVTCLAYSLHDRNRLAFGSENGNVSIVDISKGQVSHVFENHMLSATGLAFSATSSALLVSAGLDERVFFYDVIKKKLIKEMPVGAPVHCLAFHWDGQTLALGTAAGDVLVYDLKAPEAPAAVQPGAHAPHRVRSMAFQNRPRNKATAAGGVSDIKEGSIPSSKAASPALSTPAPSGEAKISLGGLSPATPEPSGYSADVAATVPMRSVEKLPSPREKFRSPPISTNVEDLHPSKEEEIVLQPPPARSSPLPTNPPFPTPPSPSPRIQTSQQALEDLQERIKQATTPRSSSVRSSIAQPQSPGGARSLAMDEYSVGGGDTASLAGGSVFGTAGGRTAGGAGFDRLMLASALEEAVGGLRADLQSDLRALHLDLLRQHQAQQEHIQYMFHKHFAEVHELVEENKKLKKQIDDMKNCY